MSNDAVSHDIALGATHVPEHDLEEEVIGTVPGAPLLRPVDLCERATRTDRRLQAGNLGEEDVRNAILNNLELANIHYNMELEVPNFLSNNFLQLLDAQINSGCNDRNHTNQNQGAPISRGS